MSTNLKVVLIGETGVGKSQLGNFILNKEFFKVGDHDKSETDRISEDKICIEGMNVTIVDTPGLNDTESRDEEIMDKIVEKFQNDNSIDGIILVYSFRIPKRVQKHKELVTNLITIFGKDLLEERLKVIFTNCSIGEERDDTEIEKERTQVEDIKEFLENMIKDDEIIFVNSKKKFYHKFLPDIVKLLNQIYKVKKEHGSINSALIKKKELEFIEKEKQKEKERLEKELQKQKEENERKRKEEIQRLEEERQKDKERLKKELQKQNEENQRKNEKEIQNLKEELSKKQNEQPKINVNLSDILNSISNYRTKISEAKQKIEELKRNKSSAIAGTVMCSIFLPLSLGFSGFGIAETTSERNKINRQIKELENDINNYKNEIDKLENLQEKLLRHL